MGCITSKDSLNLNECQEHRQQIIGICDNMKCQKNDRRVCVKCLNKSGCKHSNQIKSKFTIDDHSDLLNLLYGYTLTIAFPKQIDGFITNLNQQLQQSIKNMIQPLIEDCENEFISKYPDLIQEYLLEGAQQVLDIAKKSNFNSTTDQGFKLICNSSDQVLRNFEVVNENEYSKKIMAQIYDIIRAKVLYVDEKTKAMQQDIQKKTGMEKQNAEKVEFINLSTIQYELPIYQSKKQNKDEIFGVCTIDAMAIEAYCIECQKVLCSKCIKEQSQSCQESFIIPTDFNSKYQKLIQCCENFVNQLKAFQIIKKQLQEFKDDTMKQIEKLIKNTLTSKYKEFKEIKLDLTYEAVQQIYNQYNKKCFKLEHVNNHYQQNVLITLVKNENSQLLLELKKILDELTIQTLNYTSQLKQISQYILKDFIKNKTIKAVTQSQNKQSEQVSTIILVKNKIIYPIPEVIKEESEINEKDQSDTQKNLKKGEEDDKRKGEGEESKKIEVQIGKKDRVQEILELRKNKQIDVSKSPVNKPIIPVNKPISPVNKPISPVNKPISPVNKPISHVNNKIQTIQPVGVIKLKSDIPPAQQKTLFSQQDQFITSVIEYEDKIFCSYNHGQIIQFTAPNYVADLWDQIDCGAIGALYCFKQYDSDYLVAYVNKDQKHLRSIFSCSNRFCFVKTEAHGNKIMAIKNLNSQCYATLSLDSTIKIWSQSTHLSTQHFTGHTTFVRDLVVLNESQFISLSLNEIIHYDHQTQQTIQKGVCESPFACLQIIQDFLVIGLKEGKVELRLLKQIDKVQKQYQIFNDDEIISFIQILDTYVIMSAPNSTIKVLEMNSKKITNLLTKQTDDKAEVILVIQRKIIFGDDCDLKYIEY